MGQSPQYLIFTLEKQRYALHLSSVERIVRIVEIISLPQAPEIVLGIINLGGRIIPVFNIRSRFHLPQRETELSDKLIIANTPERTVAIMADSVQGIFEFPRSHLTMRGDVLPGGGYLEGVLKHEEGLILMHDISQFLSLDERIQLDVAMK